MPQLSLETYITQYFWLLITLFSFYIFISFVIIPKISFIIKSRNLSFDKSYESQSMKNEFTPILKIIINDWINNIQYDIKNLSNYITLWKSKKYPSGLNIKLKSNVLDESLKNLSNINYIFKSKIWTIAKKSNKKSKKEKESLKTSNKETLLSSSKKKKEKLIKEETPKRGRGRPKKETTKKETSSSSKKKKK